MIICWMAAVAVAIVVVQVFRTITLDSPESWANAISKQELFKTRIMSKDNPSTKMDTTPRSNCEEVKSTMQVSIRYDNTRCLIDVLRYVKCVYYANYDGIFSIRIIFV